MNFKRESHLSWENLSRKGSWISTDFYPLAKPRRFSGFFQFFSRPFFGSFSRLFSSCLFPGSFPCPFPRLFIPCLFPSSFPYPFPGPFPILSTALFPGSFSRLYSRFLSRIFFHGVIDRKTFKGGALTRQIGSLIGYASLALKLSHDRVGRGKGLGAG